MQSRYVFSSILFCCGLFACANPSQSRPAGPQTMIAPVVETVSVDVLAKNPVNWIGKRVKVAGVFSGWKGKCVGGPPVLKSDWMIETGTACMYVSGRLPPELSAIPPTRGFGKPVDVEGDVLIDKSGRAYILSTRVTSR